MNDEMTKIHEHSWVAAILYSLDSTEADLVAAHPDFFTAIVSAAPREVVGPWCAECFESMSELTAAESVFPSSR